MKQGFLDSFPGFTLKAIRKYLPPSIATAKGHMTQEKEGIMSTKPSNTKMKQNPSLDQDEIKTGNFMCNVINIQSGKSYSD